MNAATMKAIWEATSIECPFHAGHRSDRFPKALFCALPGYLGGEQYRGSREFAERALKLGAPVLAKPRHRSCKAAKESGAYGEKEALKLLEQWLLDADLSVGEWDRLPGSNKRKVVIAREITEGENSGEPDLNIGEAKDAKRCNRESAVFSGKEEKAYGRDLKPAPNPAA